MLRKVLSVEMCHSYLLEREGGKEEENERDIRESVMLRKVLSVEMCLFYLHKI